MEGDLDVHSADNTCWHIRLPLLHKAARLICIIDSISGALLVVLLLSLGYFTDRHLADLCPLPAHICDLLATICQWIIPQWIIPQWTTLFHFRFCLF